MAIEKKQMDAELPTLAKALQAKMVLYKRHFKEEEHKFVDNYLKKAGSGGYQTFAGLHETRAQLLTLQLHADKVERVLGNPNQFFDLKKD